MQSTEITSEETLAQNEERINRIDWASRFIALALTAVVVAIFLAAAADQPWHYIAFPVLASLPLAYWLLSARYIRLMHVELLRGYQVNLMLRTIELEKMASHDELTQLYNRRYFYEQFQEALVHAQASKRTFALLALDIDGLKKINDEYGHTVGDVMITRLARVIAKHIRISDVAARLGGDEFAVLMPDTDKRGAFALARRLWAELEETPMYDHDGLTLMLSVSIGVSGFPWGGETVDEMMHWADADMYANKMSRRLPQAATAASPPQLPDDGNLGEFDRV